MTFAHKSINTISVPLLLLMISAGSGSSHCLLAQSGGPPQRDLDSTWAGRRIVTLKGFGSYYVLDDRGQPQPIQPNGLGVNIVAVVQRVEGDRIWIKANGAGDAAVGWVNKSDAVLLDQAIPHFTARLEHDPGDWDAYLRRAESEHALNQREAAIADYTHAINLNPNEPFLFLRRGRSYRAMGACPEAAGDFEQAARLRPQWAELYNQAAGVYVDCQDPARRDPEKAIALIEHAIALDIEHPTYLTILALAYFRSGQLEKAVITQRQALESPRFPPGYREEATMQLHRYEEALAKKE